MWESQPRKIDQGVNSKSQVKLGKTTTHSSVVDVFPIVGLHTSVIEAFVQFFVNKQHKFRRRHSVLRCKKAVPRTWCARGSLPVYREGVGGVSTSTIELPKQAGACNTPPSTVALLLCPCQWHTFMSVIFRLIIISTSAPPMINASKHFSSTVVCLRTRECKP